MESSESPESSRLIRILGSPVWQFVQVVAAVIGIGVGVLVAYNIFFLQREVKALQVVILASSSLVEVEPSVATDIEVRYKGLPIGNLLLLQVKIENIGNQEIRQEDYVRPIKFMFPEQARVVDAVIVESSPPNLVEDKDRSIQKEQNIATLPPVLLNEGDRAIARFLVVNMPSKSDVQPFTVDARIAGVKAPQVVSAIEERKVQDLNPSIRRMNELLLFIGAYITASLIALILRQIREARIQMGLKDRPLESFPGDVRPYLTRASLVETSRRAMLNYVMWNIVLILFLVIVATAGSYFIFE